MARAEQVGPQPLELGIALPMHCQRERVPQYGVHHPLLLSLRQVAFKRIAAIARKEDPAAINLTQDGGVELSLPRIKDYLEAESFPFEALAVGEPAVNVDRSPVKTRRVPG